MKIMPIIRKESNDRGVIMIEQLSILQIVTLVAIAFLNIRAFHLFYTDKKWAIQKQRNRIPEKKLLTAAFLLGGLGSLLGMTTQRHKTKHLKFTFLVPIAAAITVYTVIFIFTKQLPF